MTTNPPGNDSGTPIHDRTAASEGGEVAPGVSVPSYASGRPAARPTDPGAPRTDDPYGESAAEVPFDAPLDAVPADEQLPAVPSAASAGSADGVSGSSGSGCRQLRSVSSFWWCSVSGSRPVAAW